MDGMGIGIKSRHNAVVNGHHREIARARKAGPLLMAPRRFIDGGSGQADDAILAKALVEERSANGIGARQVDTAGNKGCGHLTDAQFVVPLPRRLFPQDPAMMLAS